MKLSAKIELVLMIGTILLVATGANAQRQMEKLGWGVVAVRTNDATVYVGWRMLGTDPDDIGFNLYRVSGGVTNKLNGSQPLTNTTDFVDTTATLGQTNSYFVRPVTNAVEQAASAAYILPANAPTQQYISIPLTPPAGNIQPASPNTLMHTNSYTANDCSAADLDGDGEYEIVLKWDPNDAKDNSQEGHTGPVYLDAYKLDGTRLWRINLGKNIRAGAHYTQFMVYDLDGDGKAEVACKTAPGTIDALGTNVIMGADNPSTVYTNSSGYILTGPEYLTIFNGQTGAALVTTNYIPPRGTVADWGDSYGNRVDRFLACVAYLDGVRPSLVMCRGYYTRAVLAAWDWRNGQLTQRWVFDTGFSGGPWSAYKGQGNHQLSVGDVDGDGKDEIVYGACAINDDGEGLYSTGLGHGDAMHLSDMDPDLPGLEVWQPHEGANPTCGGGEFRDAKTGALIWGMPGTGDTGRGCAANLTATKGYQMWSAATNILRNCKGQNIGRVPGSDNFLVWWDADVIRELLDGNHIDKYGTSSDTRLLTATECSSINGTKSTPCLSADILGDWREEVIWRTSDNTALHIYTTTTPATNRFYTLMHDPQYRLAIAWQNVVYNQPPHPGFYLGAGMAPPPIPNIVLVGSTNAPPAAPSGLSATAVSSNQIDLVWTDNSTNETAFVIERSTNNTVFTQIGSTDAGVTNYPDPGLSAATTYYYRVRASNSAGSSQYSATASATTLAGPPAAPTALTATPGSTQVVLTWTASAGATSYRVKRSTTNGGPYTVVASPTSANRTDTGLVNGTTYYYVVSAVNTNGESADSAQASATPSDTYRAETASFGSGAVFETTNAGYHDTGYINFPTTGGYLEFDNVNGGSGGSATLRFRYALGVASSRTGLLIVNGVSQSITFTPSGAWTTWTNRQVTVTLNSGTSNTIRLESNGQDLANIDELTVIPTLTPPAAPTGLTAVPGNLQVALHWTGSAGATSYNVKRSTSSGGLYTTIASGVTETNYTDLAVARGDTYYYVVSALSAGGESVDSAEASAHILSSYEQWQTNYFGSTNNPSAAADADPDGDGMSNTNEFMAGTNPTNSLSGLRIISVVQQSNDVVITWTTAGGRTNVVQAAAGDADGGYTTNFIDLSGAIILPGSGDTTTNYVDVGGATNSPSRYYRIRLVP